MSPTFRIERKVILFHVHSWIALTYPDAQRSALITFLCVPFQAKLWTTALQLFIYRPPKEGKVEKRGRPKKKQESEDEEDEAEEKKEDDEKKDDDEEGEEDE